MSDPPPVRKAPADSASRHHSKLQNSSFPDGRGGAPQYAVVCYINLCVVTAECVYFVIFGKM